MHESTTMGRNPIVRIGFFQDKNGYSIATYIVVVA